MRQVDLCLQQCIKLVESPDGSDKSPEKKITLYWEINRSPVGRGLPCSTEKKKGDRAPDFFHDQALREMELNFERLTTFP